MLAQASSSEDKCVECGYPLSATMRHCPTCKADAGAPNVRSCRTEENLKALGARFEAAQVRASKSGCSNEFTALEQVIKANSGVVVSMTAAVARSLFDNSTSLYVNYERLVGANARIPAHSDDDRRRCGVSGVLFGSYADSIIYGALSLTGDGLPTYGTVHCRFRSVAIEKRTSFLERNSFRFIQEHRVVAGDKLPVGYTACWAHRHELVLAKLADQLAPGQTESDWQKILICSDGQNRENDEFVEAHIYESFDRNAIESIVTPVGRKLNRGEELDLALAISAFNRLGGNS